MGAGALCGADRGDQWAKGGTSFWHRSSESDEDIVILGAARISAEPAAGRAKLDPFVGIIDGIPEGDKGQPTKQRHTSKRIFERLRDEHGYSAGLLIAKDYVHAGWQREMFVPLRNDPGHAQADFGEALAVIGGVERKVHSFAMDLPHSDAGFVQAYPAETREALCAGHVAAFAFFGKVPASTMYNNTKLAVAGNLGVNQRPTGTPSPITRFV